MLDRDLNIREIVNDKDVLKLMREFCDAAEKILISKEKGLYSSNQLSADLYEKLSLCYNEGQRLEKECRELKDIKKTCTLNNIKAVELLNIFQITGRVEENFSRLGLNDKEIEKNSIEIIEKGLNNQKSAVEPILPFLYELGANEKFTPEALTDLETLYTNLTSIIEARELDELVDSPSSKKEEPIVSDTIIDPRSKILKEIPRITPTKGKL